MQAYCPFRKPDHMYFIFVTMLITSCGWSNLLKTYIFSIFWNILNVSPSSSPSVRSPTETINYDINPSNFLVVELICEVSFLLLPLLLCCCDKQSEFIVNIYALISTCLFNCCFWYRSIIFIGPLILHCWLLTLVGLLVACLRSIFMVGRSVVRTSYPLIMNGWK